MERCDLRISLAKERERVTWRGRKQQRRRALRRLPEPVRQSSLLYLGKVSFHVGVLGRLCFELMCIVLMSCGCCFLLSHATVCHSTQLTSRADPSLTDATLCLSLSFLFLFSPSPSPKFARTLLRTPALSSPPPLSLSPRHHMLQLCALSLTSRLSLANMPLLSRSSSFVSPAPAHKCASFTPSLPPRSCRSASVRVLCVREGGGGDGWRGADRDDLMFGFFFRFLMLPFRVCVCVCVVLRCVALSLLSLSICAPAARLLFSVLQVSMLECCLVLFSPPRLLRFALFTSLPRSRNKVPMPS